MFYPTSAYSALGRFYARKKTRHGVLASRLSRKGSPRIVKSAELLRKARKKIINGPP